MIKKSLSFSLFLLFFIGVPAIADNFVNTNVGNGLFLVVPASSVENAKATFTLIHNSIHSCKEVSSDYEDPIINRTNTLKINKAPSGLCQVVWVKDSIWHYTCSVPILSRVKWASIFKIRLNNSHFFGDFTDIEKELLFDDKTCVVKRQ